MEEKDYLQHLQGIKGLIESRTKFRALSGLSGVIAGCIAIIGAFSANHILHNANRSVYKDVRAEVFSTEVIQLLSVAALTLIGAATTGLFFSYRYARKTQGKLWNPAAIKALANFCIPAFSGAFFMLMLIFQQHYSLLAPSCLFFYGLALVNASHYMVSDVRALGVGMILTGAVAMLFPGHGLVLWTFGFGLLHIVYGAIMYFKYEQ
jgi:hypothetical protein